MSNPSQKSLKIRELEAKTRLQAQKIDTLGSICNNLLRYGCLGFVFFVLARAVGDLSGKTTLADIGFKFLGDLKIEQTVSYIVTGGSILYGLRERKLRQSKTEYLQDRIKELERRHDPRRSSSRLTPRGTTNPKDAEE